jgi:hypothetical protein
MNPRRSRQQTEMSSLPSSTTIIITTITITAIIADIMAMTRGPASSSCLADTVITTIITITTITASIAATIEYRRYY